MAGWMALAGWFVNVRAIWRPGASIGRVLGGSRTAPTGTGRAPATGGSASLGLSRTAPTGEGDAHMCVRISSRCIVRARARSRRACATFIIMGLIVKSGS